MKDNSNGKPFLMFSGLKEFFGKILRRNSEGEFPFKLGECCIIVVSRSICTDKSAERTFSDSNSYVSRFDNVSFVPSLLPSAVDLEFISTRTDDEFAAAYGERLMGETALKDIVSICDIIVNRHTPVFIITSTPELTSSSFIYVMQQFIEEEFGLKGYMPSDIEGKPVDIVYDIGDPDTIRKNIERNIALLTKDEQYFFNTIMGDMEKMYRDILSKKSEAELKDIAKSRYIFISRRYDKDKIISKIIDDIKDNGGTL